MNKAWLLPLGRRSDSAMYRGCMISAMTIVCTTLLRSEIETDVSPWSDDVREDFHRGGTA